VGKRVMLGLGVGKQKGSQTGTKGSHNTNKMLSREYDGVLCEVKMCGPLPARGNSGGDGTTTEGVLRGHPVRVNQDRKMARKTAAREAGGSGTNRGRGCLNTPTGRGAKRLQKGTAGGTKARRLSVPGCLVVWGAALVAPFNSHLLYPGGGGHRLLQILCAKTPVAGLGSVFWYLRQAPICEDLSQGRRGTNEVPAYLSHQEIPRRLRRCRMVMPFPAATEQEGGRGTAPRREEGNVGDPVKKTRSH